MCATSSFMTASDPWLDCLLATAYAAVYVMLFVFAAWVVFRRKVLTT